MQYVRPRDPALVARAHVRARRADRDRRARERARGRSQRRPAGTDHHGVVRRAGDRAARAAAARPPPPALRRARLGLAAGRRALVRRRPARPVHGQRDRRRPRRGVPARQPPRRRSGPARAWRSCSAGRRSSSTTTRATTSGDLIFTPLLFAIGWLAGFALRERAEQAEAAEVRAGVAEREREAAARIAVAEERARIARELHDIVAHAVSVMVLQVGAVRHKLPDALAEDREALRGRRADGAHGARRDAAAARAPCAATATTSSSRPSPASAASTRCWSRSRRAGLPVRLHVDGEPYPLPRRPRPLGLPDRPGGADQRAQARAREPGRRDRPLRPRRAADRGPRRRRRRRRRATATATASSASASA